MNTAVSDFDYIIAGAGCAGLSLLHHILNDKDLHHKRILVLDKAEKTKNDRTWCYWEKEPGLFEDIVFHSWDELKFHSEGFTRSFKLEEYSYKMIKGLDFYNKVLSHAAAFSNVEFRNEAVLGINSDDNYAYVETSKSRYRAGLAFNSTPLMNPQMDKSNSLLQHFQGWVIKSKEANFNQTIGTLMDFRLGQDNGATFMYVLPTSESEALVEYTLFSPEVLDREVYEVELQKYIKDYLGISNFTIEHEEYGVIPMSLAHFEINPGGQNRIVNIGTAGGYTKASSGYTFQFIQKNCASILVDLKKTSFPKQRLAFRERMFQWYDRTLLDVIINEKMTGRNIFELMFRKLSPEKILAFLGNESSLTEEIRIMNSVPLWPFLSSGIKQIVAR